MLDGNNWKEKLDKYHFKISDFEKYHCKVGSSA
jgi:hypothetical protein